MHATLLLAVIAPSEPVRLGSMCMYDSCMPGPIIEIAWLGLVAVAPFVVRRWYDVIWATAAVTLTHETFAMFARAFDSGLQYALPFQFFYNPLWYLEIVLGKATFSLVGILLIFAIAWLARTLTHQLFQTRYARTR